MCASVALPRARGQDEPARPAALGQQPVAEVRYQPSEQPLSPEQLSRLVTVKPNTTATVDDVRSTIKRLYATGRYAYVQVNAEPAQHGVTLVIETRPQWFAGPIEVEGKVKNPPNLGQLANASRLQLGQPFTDEDLKTATQSIEDLLRRNGFFRASVVPELTRDDEHQQVSFRFVVKSGDRARFAEPLVSGDTRLPSEKLASAAKYKGWFRWKLATQENLLNGVQRIREKYQKEDRLTARVDLDGTDYDAANNRARPKITANGGPKVQVRSVGADISRGTFRKYVPVFDTQEVNRDLLVEGARNLRDYFQSRGYFQAEVDFETRDVGPDSREIIYVITRGPRQKLVDVSVDGNRYFSTEDVRERMFLQPAGFLIMRHGRYSQGFVRRDEDAIRNLYRANGFRDVEVGIKTIDDFKGKAGEVGVAVNIEEGPQYFVSNFQLHGVENLDRDAIAARLASAEGQPFSEVNVALDRDFIIREYQSAGYPEAAFEWRMQPGPGPHQFAVEYFITEGQKRYVRDVLISGLNITRPRLVNPNVLLESGDALSWTEMASMQRRLYELGVFDKVDMAIQNPQGQTQNKYVVYHLEESDRYAVAAGLGGEFARIGGSDTSFDNPAGAPGFAPRASLDVSRLNLWGLGHSLNFKSRYSTLNRRALLNYSAPRYRNVEGRNISVTALYDDTRDVRTFTARRLEGSGQISQRFSKATMGFFRYTYRDSRVDENTLKINPLLVPVLAQPARVGILSASFARDRRDDPTDARRGTYQTADIGLASRWFASRSQFARMLLRNSWYKSFKTHYVFATNTQFGWLGPYSLASGVDPTQAVPLPERFFGGGSTSHRGFPDNQAGPRDSVTGFPLGGNALLFHNSELRFPFLSDNIDGVLFHDLGNIYSSPSKISFRVHQRDVTDFDYMVHAAGVGIRYRTPLGPVRVDLAYSINPPSFYGFKGTRQQLLLNQGTRQLQNVSHFQFFFSIGQAF